MSKLETLAALEDTAWEKFERAQTIALHEYCNETDQISNAHTRDPYIQKGDVVKLTSWPHEGKLAVVIDVPQYQVPANRQLRGYKRRILSALITLLKANGEMGKIRDFRSLNGMEPIGETYEQKIT